MRALRLLLLFGGFGLLPFWASLVYVYAGSRNAGSDYWNAAPWLIGLSLPFCAITLAMAGITFAVYAGTKGDNSRKLKRALSCFALLTVLVLGGAGLVWNRYQGREADIAAEREAGKAFVEQHAEVIAVAPKGFRVGLSSSRMVDNLPVEYTYYVHSRRDPAPAYMAIVEVSRNGSESLFRLRCVVAETDYKNLQAGSDPC